MVYLSRIEDNYSKTTLAYDPFVFCVLLLIPSQYSRPGSLFVNLSWISPDSVRVVNNRVVAVDTNQPVACIMLGFVAGSNLMSPMEQYNSKNSDAPSTRFHQVSIAPFGQFFRREVAMWGHLFKFVKISASIFAEGIGMSFGTRPDPSGGDNVYQLPPHQVDF